MTPLSFAGFLSFYVVMSVHVLFFNKPSVIPKRFFYLALACLLLSLFLLLFTFSRSAWLSLAFVVVWVATRRHLPIRYLHVLLVIVVLTICSFFLSPIPFLGKESIDVRVALNQSALKIIQSHLISGVGLKNFLVVLPDALPSRTIYFLQPVHNIYLLLLTELGAVFVSIFSFLSFVRIRFSFFSSRYAAFLFLFLLIGLFDHYPLTLQQGQFLLVFSVGLYFLGSSDVQ